MNKRVKEKAWKHRLAFPLMPPRLKAYVLRRLDRTPKLVIKMDIPQEDVDRMRVLFDAASDGADMWRAPVIRSHKKTSYLKRWK
jgi:hypothetical protein